MSFIDRMLQDMLHRNMSGRGAARMARKAVRRIGTRRLLMMGGAALAGGLLTEAARRQGAASPTVPAGGGQAPPPLPPVPGRSGVASPPPGLPPLPVPGAAGAPPAAEEPPVLDLPPGTLFAALRTMVAAALSDGELSAQERELIESRLAESGLPAERVAQVRRDLVLPATPPSWPRCCPRASRRSCCSSWRSWWCAPTARSRPTRAPGSASSPPRSASGRRSSTSCSASCWPRTDRAVVRPSRSSAASKNRGWASASSSTPGRPDGRHREAPSRPRRFLEAADLPVGRGARACRGAGAHRIRRGGSRVSAPGEVWRPGDGVVSPGGLAAGSGRGGAPAEQELGRF
jgi:hypothetical protein